MSVRLLMPVVGLIGSLQVGLLVSPACLADDVTTRSDDSAILPAWHGRWEGRLENLPLKPDARLISVSREIAVGDNATDGCLVWKTEFLEAGVVQQVKNYQLCRRQDGSYVVDEGGGVVLAATLVNGALVSVFSARDSVLVNQTSVEGNIMTDEIIFARPGSAAPSDSDEQVISYVVGGIQKVTYERAGSTPDLSTGR